MALSEAFGNMASNYRFHLSVRGGLFFRLAYITLYYLIFVCIRWGDRYGRPLRWLKSLYFSDILVEVETKEGVRFEMDLHTAFDPLYSTFYSKDYLELDGFGLRSGEVVIDAGANIGVYAMCAAHRVGKEGVVIAIEPHPLNFALLTRNAERNGFKNVRLLECAVDAEPGTAELYVHERAINHSLVRKSGKAVSVEVKTIDGIVQDQALQKIDVIKIDTEGNVPEILNGAKESISKYRPRIVIERDAPDEMQGVEEFLKNLDYRTRDVRTLTYAWPA